MHWPGIGGATSAPSPCRRVLQLTVANPREANLAWLDKLPNSHTLCADVCLKGLSCNSYIKATVSTWQFMRLWRCVEEPGGHENGHEGVCAFRFLLDHYDSTAWDGVYFLHGDVHSNPRHSTQFNAFRTYLARAEWPAWPALRMDVSAEHCGCDLDGVRKSPFGPRDFWYNALSWWLGTMITRREPSDRHRVEAWQRAAECARSSDRLRCSRSGDGAYPIHQGVLSSPLGFMFGVDRASALLRTRRFYEAQYRLCRVGLRAMPKGRLGAPAAAFLRAPGFDYNPLVYGHVNERLPYFLFIREFEERPVPDCIWTGDHATMNCTQPLIDAGAAPLTPPGAGSRTHPERAANLSMQPAADVRGACRPFERHCGTVMG